MLHKIVLFLVSCLLLLGVAYGYYYNRWKRLWAVTTPMHFYYVPHVEDDTLRVIMIGDSWASIHSELQMDTFLSSKLEQMVHHPVSVISKGKGGEKSKGIYQLMFQTEDYGTKQLFINGADYCIVLAGINDAAANLGTRQYCSHYRMILDFLLANNIRPVIVEIPDVNIWTIHGDKPKKDLLVDYMRSIMTGCRMYNYHEYREELYSMLQKEHLLEQVVYVSMSGWNSEEDKLKPILSMADRVHLNRLGYERLDVCIATAIARNLLQFCDSTSVNQPMDKKTQ